MATQIVDVRKIQEDDQRTYIVLGDTKTYKFFWGEGQNYMPWDELQSDLIRSLPQGSGKDFHNGIGNVSIDNIDIVIDGSSCDLQNAGWICRELISRGLVAESRPVILAHADGYEEPLGYAGTVSKFGVKKDSGVRVSALA